MKDALLRDFFGLPPARKRPTPAASETTDRPDFKLLALQTIRAYSGVCDAELSWVNTFRDKESGKTFKVTVTLREVQ